MIKYQISGEPSNEEVEKEKEEILAILGEDLQAELEEKDATIHIDFTKAEGEGRVRITHPGHMGEFIGHLDEHLRASRKSPQ